ncbi:MAG TPA: hypothetical protein VFV86_02200 [Nitrososphaeraceae archaeon]|nr:hypothetical protein [Nitrososphaeraceae archaeon]
MANEPVAVDDKTNVVSPNMTDPTNPEAEGTQPITGLENSLKVDIMAGNKTLSSNLDQHLENWVYMNQRLFIPPFPQHLVL